MNELGMGDWVGHWCWLYTLMLCLSADSHPSK